MRFLSLAILPVAFIFIPRALAHVDDADPAIQRISGPRLLPLSAAIQDAQEIPTAELNNPLNPGAQRALRKLRVEIQRAEHFADRLPLGSTMSDADLVRGLKRIHVADMGQGGVSPYAVIFYIFPEQGPVQYLKFKSKAEAMSTAEVQALHPGATVKRVSFDALTAR